MIKDRRRIREIIAGLIKEQLNTLEVSGKNLIYADMIERYVLNILRRDIEYLKEHGSERFRMLGTERRMYMNIKGFSFTGFIDRLDSPCEGLVRVVDYKTGKVEKEDTDISESNAEKVSSLAFHPEPKKWPKIALQLFIYNEFIYEDRGLLPEIKDAELVSSIYQTRDLFTEKVKDVRLPLSFIKNMRSELYDLLDELADPTADFTLTDNTENCKYCDFKTLCGR